MLVWAGWMLGATAAELPSRLDVALGAGVVTSSQAGVGAAGSGRIGVHVVPDRWVLDVGLREGAVSGALRVVSTVVVAARWAPTARTYVSAGFAHNHEAAWADFAAAPLPTMIGTSSALVHRSGLTLGGGVALPVPGLPGPAPRWTVGVVADLYPDGVGPTAYVGVEQALRWTL